MGDARRCRAARRSARGGCGTPRASYSDRSRQPLDTAKQPRALVPACARMDVVPLADLAERSNARSRIAAGAAFTSDREDVTRAGKASSRLSSSVLSRSAGTAVQADPVTIAIGGTAITIRTDSPEFRRLLTDRYAGFVATSQSHDVELEIELFEPADTANSDDDLRLSRCGPEWSIQRGDFRACWNAVSGRGWVRQPPSPYAIDSVLRIIHSLILAKQGGFLLHAASAIRGGQASLFAGVSGAGKTTISRLAPSDATLLTDEISYVIRGEQAYCACGTPFAGELARVGENVSAPIKAVFLLEKGPDNRIEAVSEAEAVRSLLRHVLFFADDGALVNEVFRSVCEFVNQVPVRRLIFVPDERVWNIIG